MIHIVDTEEFEKDGITYIRETYSNGGMVEYPKPIPQPDPPAYMNNLIDEGSEMQLEQAMNIQYLTDLAEINMEG